MSPWRRRAAEKRTWPFWLLLAAWVCANSPQLAVYAVLTWLAEARSFEHQQELSREVAHLLVGEKVEGRVARSLARIRVEAGEEDRRTKPPVQAPTVVVITKVDLAAEDVAVVAVGRPVKGNSGYVDEGGFGRARRVAPPHGPPRVSLG